MTGRQTEAQETRRSSLGDLPAPERGAGTLQMAMLIGALAVVGISFANQRQISRLDDRLSARLQRVETRLQQASSAQPIPPPGEQSPPEQSESDAQPSAADPNSTLSALVGVKPVGTKMPSADRIYEFDLTASPSKGPAGAPISIIEFSDFQCNFCRKAQPTLARIEEVYGDQIRRIWKHLPLSMHQDAPMAHLASVAAANQGRFWEFQEKLFADQARLKPDDLRQHAYDLGLKMQQFEDDLADPTTQKVVESDMAEAVAIDLTATPGFFINGRYIRGAKPFEVFAEVINDELARLGQPIPEAARVEPES